jgi:hypothetical protein
MEKTARDIGLVERVFDFAAKVTQAPVTSSLSLNELLLFEDESNILTKFILDGMNPVPDRCSGTGLFCGRMPVP